MHVLVCSRFKWGQGGVKILSAAAKETQQLGEKSPFTESGTDRPQEEPARQSTLSSFCRKTKKPTGNYKKDHWRKNVHQINIG